MDKSYSASTRYARVLGAPSMLNAHWLAPGEFGGLFLKSGGFRQRDAHNWTSWRDALHPHLRDLALRAWT